MEFLITLHGHMRFVVFTAAGIAVVALFITMLTGKSLEKIAKVLVRMYATVLTIQFLLGLIQLVVRWNDFGDGLRYRLEHAALMFLAVGAAHMTNRFMKRNTPAAVRPTFALVAGSILLVVLGIMILPQGRFALGMG